MTKQHNKHKRGSHLTTTPTQQTLTLWQLTATVACLATFIAMVAGAFGLAYISILTLGE